MHGSKRKKPDGSAHHADPHAKQPNQHAGAIDAFEAKDIALRNKEAPNPQPNEDDPANVPLKTLTSRLGKHVASAIGCFVFGVFFAALLLPPHMGWFISAVIYVAAGLSTSWLGLQVAKLCSVWPFEPPPPKTSLLGVEVQDNNPKDASPWLSLADIKKAINAFSDECDRINSRALDDSTKDDAENPEKGSKKEAPVIEYVSPKKKVFTLRKPHRTLPTESADASAQHKHTWFGRKHHAEV